MDFMGLCPIPRQRAGALWNPVAVLVSCAEARRCVSEPPASSEARKAGISARCEENTPQVRMELCGVARPGASPTEMKLRQRSGRPFLRPECLDLRKASLCSGPKGRNSGARRLAGLRGFDAVGEACGPLAKAFWRWAKAFCRWAKLAARWRRASVGGRKLSGGGRRLSGGGRSLASMHGAKAMTVDDRRGTLEDAASCTASL
jgi:hypothetical protein